MRGFDCFSGSGWRSDAGLRQHFRQHRCGHQAESPPRGNLEASSETPPVASGATLGDHCRSAGEAPAAAPARSRCRCSASS
jgi:hypothetical protein